MSREEWFIGVFWKQRIVGGCMTSEDVMERMMCYEPWSFRCSSVVWVNLCLDIE